MFQGLYNIINIDLSKFDSSEVTDMSNMFKGCSYLASINLNNLNTLKVTNMSQMFYHCESLTFLDLNSFNTFFVKDMFIMFAYCYGLKALFINNFNTLNVIDMEGMFYYCESLLSLNLRSFNTSSVIWMDSMFSFCKSLISLDLSNFNTSNVIYMYSMFYYCKSLKTLDLSSFDTRKVYSMYNMFSDCHSLLSLNLNSFNTSQIISMESMFENCKSLISLNLSHFNVKNIGYYYYAFYNLNYEIIMCINDDIRKTFYLYSYHNYDCSDICFTNLNHKIIKEDKKCIDKCINDNNYKYEYEGVCYKSCPPRTNNTINNIYLCKNFTCEYYYNYDQTGCIEKIEEGYYLNDSFFKTIDKCNEKCKSCDLESVKKYKCLTCNVNGGYYPILDNGLNISQYSFINCIDKTPYGYFFENETYKPCYYSCKECIEL